MNCISYYKKRFRVATLVLFAGTMFCYADSAEAQFRNRWLSVGSLHQHYNEGGIETFVGGRGTEGLQWPAIDRHAHSDRAKLYYIAAKDFTNASGESFPVKVVHQGGLEDASNQVFPQQFQVVSKFENPTVTVDGLQSFDKVVVPDKIDPSMKADRKIVNVVNTQLGIELKRVVKQFSNEYHDNYHIHEITLTNTGNVDDDAQIELNEPLTGVYYWEYNRYDITAAGGVVEGGGAGWGQYAMQDAFWMGEMEDFDVDFSQESRTFEAGFSEKNRGFVAWHGYNPNFTEWNNIGVPILEQYPEFAEEDTVGRLAGYQFVGRNTLHADMSSENKADDFSQPSTIAPVEGSNTLIFEFDPFARTQMQAQYEMITRGRVTPTHADLIMPPSDYQGMSWRERFANQKVDGSRGVIDGIQYGVGYGPYDLEHNESFKIVLVEAASGLSREAALEIGKAYKEAHEAGDDDRAIAFDADGDGIVESDEKMSKNMWVMTGRDSLLLSYERARRNYESGYAIPREPKPPREFRVASGPDRVLLEWSTFSGEQVESWEIYRAQGRYDAPYSKIAELEGSARRFEDEDLKRGVGYYYYLQAVGKTNNDGTGLTPTGIPLKSNRYYTQTYDPASLKRPEGSLEEVVIVPSPYSLSADRNIRWPDVQDQIAFLEVPGQCIIRIYTETGELVETIEHTDGSGDAFWDLTTSYNQVVAPGIYMAVIEDDESGEQAIKKFTIIR